MKKNSKAPLSADSFGPEYVIRIHDPKIGMTGFLVIHNTVLGPGKGGIRMTKNVSAEEVLRLATTMTWKNSLAGIPFGGAKAGIVWQGGSDELKKQFIQSFAKSLKPLMPKKYIAGPDVNTGEREMQWFVEATGNWVTATGKPANYCAVVSGKKTKKCGLPHELGSTGFGVVKSAVVAAELAKINIKGATVAIHGFGNVGTFAYKFLTELGAKVVALADSVTTAYSPTGFDQAKVTEAIKNKQRLANVFPKLIIPNEKFWSLPVDILIPASVTDVINDSNKNSIRAKVIVEAGNIPMRESIENELWKKGILIVPDFIANAGGVISSYAEYKGYAPKQMFKMVEEKITQSTRAVLKESLARKENPRITGMKLAMAKVQKHSKKKE